MTIETKPDDANDPNEVAALRAQLDSAGKETEAVAASLLADVPARLQGLIPEGLDAAGKVRWFLKAKQSGVFAAAHVPATDISKPTVSPKEPDVSSLPPVARMSRGYTR